MKRFLVIAALLAAAAPAAATAQDNDRPALGAGRGDQDQARDAVRAGRQVPLARVLAMIAARTPGRHLNTTQGEDGGRPVYFVQWQMLPSGQVVVFVVDAVSGQQIRQQGR
ncbi:hypothetical protein DJ021_02610 [Phenylobacterium hankyongense]|uniref:PepSY domain-containing protein n=1 Tax=Phenylobacterium hankyongense TaxID=1813876 RepID=A0A328AUS9_9CAUL|nr:hypothetical protein [Phenylobacterium hankyongense]RAK58770.1 hypothetical protein DJ021_02610 [Phenylobacterium hankyongense]